ncbi:acyltransferase family protein [Allokutzneria oryzae]|uniref:Acyltransferase family protein n=1 Tax=Allokutzneria oryzae TaxID=1378989 RepID=A0ABV5ZTE1_9PSEU
MQGLRAVAVVLVVVYHVWLGRVSGGVDVFFLLTGFLLTGQLVRAATSESGIRFVPLWGRVITRLFPAALTVLAVTMAVAVVVLPESRWFQTIREIVASALFLENWQLVADSADYFAHHDEAGVTQHFWSLSIQGQFYVLWPLLVAGVVLVARRAGRGVRRSLLVAQALVFAASLAFSVVFTATQQQVAYFHSLTRVWEFALGGLLALVVDAVVLPRRARVVLGWVGILGLVACGLVLSVGSVFPGYVALWPTLCGAAVIAAGTTGSRYGADRWLVTPALRYVGDLSYALYLWHWPVLVFYLVARDRTHVGLAGGVVIIGVSLVLSVLTHHYVEKPVRVSRLDGRTRWGAYRFAVLTLVPVLVAAGCWQTVSLRKAASYDALVDDLDHPGALARTPEFEYWGAEDAAVIPPLITLYGDFAGVEGSRCTVSPRNPELEICSTSPPNPTKHVVVVGDSHMQQLLAALDPIARERDWKITHMLRGACPFSTSSETAIGDQACVRWNADARAEIISRQPDLVFANGTRNARIGLTEATPPGFVAAWRALESAGIPVLAVRDNPRFDYSPAVCAATNGVEAPQCNPPRSQILAPEAPYSSLANIPATVSFLDLSDYYCTESVCPPIIGNVHVYFDDNHVTATYMRSMAPLVKQAIDAVLTL